MHQVCRRRCRTSIIKDVERLDAVSVRESETIPYLINEVGIKKEILHTVDPTLLLDAENYIDSFQLKIRNENYIFVYFIFSSNLFFNSLNLDSSTK